MELTLPRTMDVEFRTMSFSVSRSRVAPGMSKAKTLSVATANRRSMEISRISDADRTPIDAPFIYNLLAFVSSNLLCKRDTPGTALSHLWFSAHQQQRNAQIVTYSINCRP